MSGVVLAVGLMGLMLGGVCVALNGVSQKNKELERKVNTLSAKVDSLSKETAPRMGATQNPWKSSIGM